MILLYTICFNIIDLHKFIVNCYLIVENYINLYRLFINTSKFSSPLMAFSTAAVWETLIWAQTSKQLVRTRFALVQAQTSRAPLFNQNSSDKMSRSARSLSHAHPTPPPSANSAAPSRRHRRKMQPPDCISRYDRIISGKRRLKRLPAARLHRKTGVIPDYNVTAVSRRFTFRFDRQPDCYDRPSPRCPPLSSPWRRLYKKLSGITD